MNPPLRRLSALVAVVLALTAVTVGAYLDSRSALDRRSCGCVAAPLEVGAPCPTVPVLPAPVDEPTS